MRENLEKKGRYIINHGARRYRASKLAGKHTIPAFIDNDYNETDQVIENLQRDALTAREIANFIGREIARGKKKKDIANEIGKSNSFVSQYVTLLDLPEEISEIFNSGRVTDVTVINELVVLYKQNRDVIIDYINDNDEDITRKDIVRIREFLNSSHVGFEESFEEYEEDYKNTDNSSIDFKHREEHIQNNEEEKRTKKTIDDNIIEYRIKKPIIIVEYNKRTARLLFKNCSKSGFCWIKYDEGGQETMINMKHLKLTHILEG